MPTLKKVWTFLRENWEILSGIGLSSAYVVTASDNLRDCFSTVCAVWISIPVFAAGAAVGYAMATTGRKPLTFVPRPGHLRASKATEGGQPVTQLVGEWWVTSKKPTGGGQTGILAGYIKKPRTQLQLEHEPIVVDATQLGSFVAAGFLREPYQGKDSRLTVVFVDHVGREYVLKKQVFTATP
jgi:hypothetical protein